MSGGPDAVGRARALSSPAEVRALYREWAPHYDHEVFTEAGFTGSDRIADLLAAYVEDRSTTVLDLGCGTGAVGRRLHHHGFTAIDGYDLSPEMLEFAGRTNSYRHLHTVDLTRPFPVSVTAAAPYGASVSAGTFTSGHVGPAVVSEVVGLLGPGAVVAWVIARAVWPGFEQAIESAGLLVRSAHAEAVRRGGPLEAIMLVAARPSSRALNHE